MRFVPIREFRLHPGEVWRRLSKEGELVLTARGRPMGLLTQVDSASLEEILRTWRQARGLAALSKLQAQARERDLDRMTQRQINTEIRSVRELRRRRHTP